MQYLGGKSRLGRHLVAEMDFSGFDRFHEPFVGGFNIIPHVPRDIECVASDSCAGLISMYTALQDGWVPPSSVSEEDYEWVRSGGDQEDPMWGFVGYGCSFGGKLWGGYARNGRGDNYAQQASRSLIKKLPHINRTQFSCVRFNGVAPSKSVVYCDPPYQNATGYKGQCFEADLFERYVEQAGRDGNRVYVSEFDGSYAWPVIWRKDRNLEMHPRKKKTEVLMLVEKPN